MKQVSIFLLCLCYLGIATAQVYDPVTNTYIYPAEVVETTNETTVADTTNNANDTDNMSDSGESDTNAAIETGAISSIDAQVTESILEQEFDGVLEYLHEELQTHQVSLLQELEERYAEVQSELVNVAGGVVRLDIVQCLGLVEGNEQVADAIAGSYLHVKNSIYSVAVDLHNDIDALEVKIDQKLLTDIEELLQISSLQSKVNAYVEEFLNTTDTFSALTHEGIGTANDVIADLSPQQKSLLDTYDERTETYKELEEAYADFLGKSSFAGGVVGPNIPEVTKLIEDLKIYYRSFFTQAWTEKVTIYVPSWGAARTMSHDVYKLALRTFDASLDKQVEGMLGDLYPVEDLQFINTTLLTLRSGYISPNGAYDCTAFATNKTIDIAAPKLIEQMDNVLSDLNTAANKVERNGELPTSIDELQRGLITLFSSDLPRSIDTIVTEYKRELERDFSRESLTMLSRALPAESDKWELIVRGFIQKKWYDEFKDDNLDWFIEILENADVKIEKGLEQAEGRTKHMLEVIQKVIREFL